MPISAGGQHAADDRGAHDLARHATRRRVAVHSGTQPRMNAKDVIKMGRRRRRAPSSAASASGFALLKFVLGELDDEDRVFRGQADEHDEPNLRVHIVFDLHHVGRKESAQQDAAQPEGSRRRRNTATGVLSRTLKGSDQLS